MKNLPTIIIITASSSRESRKGENNKGQLHLRYIARMSIVSHLQPKMEIPGYMMEGYLDQAILLATPTSGAFAQGAR